MLIKAIKARYRKLCYPFLKIAELAIRCCVFKSCEIFLPRFNAFRLFGVPSGLATLTSEEIYPEEQVLRTIPKTLDPLLIPSFTPLPIPTPGGALSVVPGGFATCAAATLTSAGKLVPEFSEQFTMKKGHDHKLFTFRRNRCFTSIPHFEGTVASLTVDCQTNYYHWLFDALPKIHLLRKKGLPIDYFYADTSQRFQKETLQLLGISLNQVIDPKKNPIISAERLVATSFPCLKGLAAWVCAFLRDSFLTKNSGSKITPPSAFLFLERMHPIVGF